jgi:hypothetical protein
MAHVRFNLFLVNTSLVDESQKSRKLVQDLIKIHKSRIVNIKWRTLLIKVKHLPPTDEFQLHCGRNHLIEKELLILPVGSTVRSCALRLGTPENHIHHRFTQYIIVDCNARRRLLDFSEADCTQYLPCSQHLPCGQRLHSHRRKMTGTCPPLRQSYLHAP